MKTCLNFNYYALILAFMAACIWIDSSSATASWETKANDLHSGTGTDSVSQERWSLNPQVNLINNYSHYYLVMILIIIILIIIIILVVILFSSLIKNKSSASLLYSLNYMIICININTT